MKNIISQYLFKLCDNNIIIKMELLAQQYKAIIIVQPFWPNNNIKYIEIKLTMATVLTTSVVYSIILNKDKSQYAGVKTILSTKWLLTHKKKYINYICINNLPNFVRVVLSYVYCYLLVKVSQNEAYF